MLSHPVAPIPFHNLYNWSGVTQSHPKHTHREKHNEKNSNPANRSMHFKIEPINLPPPLPPNKPLFSKQITFMQCYRC